MSDQRPGDFDVEPSALPPTSSPYGQQGAYEATEELEQKYHYQQELHRGLNVVQLTAYGINWMAPLAPGLVFGLILQASGTTVGLAYFIAGVAMMFTAASYAIMVQNFPLAGSVYNYVSKGMSPHIGFMMGWIMIADYLLWPALCTMSAAYYLQQVWPVIPYWLFIFGLAAFTFTMNIIGVELMATIGLWLLFIQEAIVLTSWAVWAWSAQFMGAGFGTAFTLEPLKFDNVGALMSATAISVLSYLGYDAVTTLSEEANNPKRDIPRAVYWSLIVAGAVYVGTGYFGMLPIKDITAVVNDAAWIAAPLYFVSEAAAGRGFAIFYTGGFVLMTAIFNVVSTAAAARILYGMGRDELLPKPFFGAINKRFGTPHFNVALVVFALLAMAIYIPYNTVAGLINFGAIGGFWMLNFLTIYMYIIRRNGVAIDRYPAGSAMYYLRFLLIPGLGFLIVGWVFFSLGQLTLMFGAAWSVLGIIYLAIRTKGFRELPPILEV